MRAEIAVEPSSKASLLKELKIKTKYFGWGWEGWGGGGGGEKEITPASHTLQISQYFFFCD